ncbi:carboxypeptidase-like regulatory domain-containing protein [Maribacter arcticus]|uniref:carboxypeptidase-like regulatory domain-containing protein n=1 Tax=Maribacter arcticus TaxID=561365 RepID=UPI003002753D
MNNSILSKGIVMMTISFLALCTSPINGQETTSLETNIEVVSTETLGKIAFIETEQEQFLVKGTVLDEANEPLPRVNVLLKGKTVGIQTDIDGKCEFPQELEVNDVLVFSYIGYETNTYKVAASKSSTIVVNITFDTYDVELIGQVVIDGAYSSKRNVFQKFISIFK